MRPPAILTSDDEDGDGRLQSGVNGCVQSHVQDRDEDGEDGELRLRHHKTHGQGQAAADEKDRHEDDEAAYKTLEPRLRRKTKTKMRGKEKKKQGREKEIARAREEIKMVTMLRQQKKKGK